MVTLISTGVNGTEYAGLSSDSKPTEGVPNGATFVEMNTGKLYFFDADNETWIEWGSSNASVGLPDGGGVVDAN